MPATSNVRKRGALHRRRIIERPRLLALLSGSPARVRTLIAPAGYGKTTLAEQWVGQEGRRHAWFTARPSSTDVAALALGLARAATAIVPDCDARLREHLRALPAPAEHVDVLAELLGEDLAAWPEDAWLVLDDYHELIATGEAETFVDELVATAPVQLLIASRQRPTWIKARNILYGEALELNQTELAMDGHEAAEVLTGRNAASASGLVALADGWPAVIGLASVSTAEIEQPDVVPEALYQFFAEEVFGALPSDVRAGLTILAIAPVLDRSLAQRLLGESCDRICGAALDVGILVERDARLEIHPLARAFIETQLHESDAPSIRHVERCIAYFRERKDWDAAFDLIVRRGHPEQLGPLMAAALDELLETARLSTIETWCTHASTVTSGGPTFSVARAEVALRCGRLTEAQALAEAAAARPSPVRVRALLTAGRAAHVSSLDTEAVELFRRAEAAATDTSSRREARWGLALCYADLELPEARPILEELAAGVHDAREAVRAAGYRFTVTVTSGTVELAPLDRAAELLPAVADPLVKSAFLSVYASGLAMAARYDDAREAAGSLLEIAQRYRLDFALPYAYCPIGVAAAGSRNWALAERWLRKGLAEARKTSSGHGEQSCVAALLRTLAQRGALESALTLSREHASRPAQHATVGMHSELVGTQAFVLAAADQLPEASALSDSIRGQSSTAEAVVILRAVDAIVCVRQHRPDAIDVVLDFAELAFSTGALDLLLTTYRAVPEILAILLRSPESARVYELLRRVGDEKLGDALGLSLTRQATAPLTRRERQVHELLGQGLTNKEIARLLVIAEGTAKRHVQNIYDKLGVRSRTTIAVHAAIERAQATSAIDDTGNGSDS